jgi:hypothetical protein
MTPDDIRELMSCIYSDHGFGFLPYDRNASVSGKPTYSIPSYQTAIPIVKLWLFPFREDGVFRTHVSLTKDYINESGIMLSLELLLKLEKRKNSMTLQTNKSEYVHEIMKSMFEENKHKFTNMLEDYYGSKNNYYFDESHVSGIEFIFTELRTSYNRCSINNLEFCEETVVDIWNFKEDLKSIKGAWR